MTVLSGGITRAPVRGSAGGLRRGAGWRVGPRTALSIALVGTSLRRGKLALLLRSPIQGLNQSFLIPFLEIRHPVGFSIQL